MSSKRPISYKAQISSRSLKDYIHPRAKGSEEPIARGTKMTTIREEAVQYEAPKTLNIADLPKVSTELDLHKKTATDSEGKEFSYKYIIADDIEYRVPQSVIIQLNQLMEDNPDMLWFTVKKSGEGLKTIYRVDPVVE